MNALTDPNGWFVRFTSRLLDLIVLGALTMVCCIPVVTIGAALSANHAVTINMALQKDTYLFANYFSAFGKNFKKATAIWLICLAGICLVGANFYLLLTKAELLGDTLQTVLFVAGCLLAVLLAFVIEFAFPLQARFENKIGVTLKNAFFISLAKFPTAFTMLVVHVLLVLVAAFFTVLIPVVIYVEFAFVTYFMAFSYIKVFASLGDKEAAQVLGYAKEEDEDSGEGEEADKKEEVTEVKTEEETDNGESESEEKKAVEETTEA